VQGGGIRLEAVTGGTVTGSSFARTWNGIELRGTRGVTVQDNVADHCSNTGATLADAHDNVIADNDFSWAIRGDGLSFPDAWYGIDTRDSAGVIVDAGSSGNRITGNDFRYGGDGVFIRSVIGRCATDNHVEGNDTSFSPHNAIECWCDGNAFVDNVASDSHYGIWLGGTDRGLVRGNTVERNVVDGISIQIGEDRHTIIEDNRIARSGRVGLLLTGREYQAWHDLGFWADRLANSSHLVIQRNEFEANGAADVFITSTRGVVLASNCTVGGGQPMARGLREAELIATVGTCGGAEGRTAPTAALTSPGRATPGTPLLLDASGSAPSAAGGSLVYHWLVQRAATRFEALALPPIVLGGEGPAMPSVTFTEPGLYDVDVTVSDGSLAALAFDSIAVVPAGRSVGAAPSDWTHGCLMSSACTVSFAAEPDGIDGAAVRATADAPFGFRAIAPATRDLGADLTSSTTIAMFVRGRNDNPGGWQGSFPVVVLGGPGGEIRYEPMTGILPTDPSEWIYVEVPLAGGRGWTRTEHGAGLDAIDWIAIEADTWEFRPVDVWVDALTVY
jgi:parallel beta-helix repeat protein